MNLMRSCTRVRNLNDLFVKIVLLFVGLFSLIKKKCFACILSYSGTNLNLTDFTYVFGLILTYLFHNCQYNMSLVMRKPAFCICENKDADQLRGNSEADQRLCFSYIASTIPLLPKYRISSLWPFSVIAQPGLS